MTVFHCGIRVWSCRPVFCEGSCEGSLHSKETDARTRISEMLSASLLPSFPSSSLSSWAPGKVSANGFTMSLERMPDLISILRKAPLICVCIYIHVYVYVCIYIHICVYMCVCIYICICMCICICICICIYIYMHIYIARACVREREHFGSVAVLSLHLCAVLVAALCSKVGKLAQASSSDVRADLCRSQVLELQQRAYVRLITSQLRFE